MLIKSIVEKRLERLIFIRAELLKPQPSIRGEHEQASLSQLSEASVSKQASVNYSTSVSEQGGIFEPSATSPDIEGIIILRKR